MKEMIGEVELDLSFYPGEDLYCDGESEDVLLDIVKNEPVSAFSEIAAEKKSWPLLYHLSDIRENIVSWMDLKPGAKVLEIGAGCGAVTGAFLNKGYKLTCVELSKKRSSINAYRHRADSGFKVIVGNFEDIEGSLDRDFDYIFLTGVLEYAKSYIHAEDPFREFVRVAKSHLKEDGSLVIAIENRLGLKYFAGAREDHLGSYFSGIEDYPEGGPAKTFSKPVLEGLLSDFKELHFYYPYPDYKFPLCIYSDERLPEPGELSVNLLNLDRSRLLLFNERNAYDALIKDGLYPLFSNSFLIVAGKAQDAVYCKFSNDRDPKYAIRTEILRDGRVRKSALKPEGREHLKAIVKACRGLKEKYEGSGLEVVCFDEEGDGIVSPLVSGVSLERLLDEAALCGNEARIKELLARYRGFAEYRPDYALTDLDMSFSNVLIDGDSWKLIDPEWVEYEAGGATKAMARALFIYLSADEARGKLTGLFTQCLGTEPAEEDVFRKKIAGERVPLGRMNAILANEVTDIKGEMGRLDAEKRLSEPRIYFDRGSGFSEADSIRPEIRRIAEKKYELKFAAEAGIKTLRFDPCMCVCALGVEEASFNGKKLKLKTNGRSIGRGYVFNGEDPNILFSLKGATGELKFIYSLSVLPPELGDALCQ